MSIDVNVQNDLVIVTESSEDITVNVSNAAGPAGVGVPVGGSTGQVLKKLSNTNYDTYWALDGGGVPYSGATGDVDLGEYELKAGQVEFDQTPTGTAGVAVMRWNDSDGTVDLGLKGGNVTLQVGQEQILRVVNKTGANLLESQYRAVRIRLAAEGGSQGQRLAVVLAQGNNDANSTDTIGIVTENITDNQEGFICTSGIIRGINTTGSLQGETWADGDIIYLSPTIAGAITTVKPTAPNHSVILGYVIYAHNVNGKIFVKCDNGYELGELHDVYVPTPSNNDGIFWNTANSRYQNNSIAGVLGYTPISGSGVTGQVAYWNGTNSQTGSNNLFWDNANARLGIGTNAPIEKLQIVGGFTVSANSFISAGNLSIFTTNTPRRINLEVANGSKAAAIGIQTLGVIHSVIGVDTSGTDFLQVASKTGISFYSGSTIGNIVTDPTNERMRLTSAGRLLLGTTTESTFILDVNGTARVSGAATFSSTLTLSSRLTLNGVGTSEIYTTDASGLYLTAETNGGMYIASESRFIFRKATSPFTEYMRIESTGNVCIGTISSSASAILQADSTTKGFLPPRMTNAQRTAISSPAVGLMVYCTDATEGLYQYINNAWVNLTGVVTNRQTASYTLALGDSNDLVEMNVATANNLTVPLNSSIAFPIGTKIDLAQYGAGQTTVVATSGVTVRSAGGALKLAVQYSGASLVKIGTDEWYLFGDITV